MSSSNLHAREVAQSFLIQLQDLTDTARTKINALTEIAESFRQFARPISEVVVQHISKCASKHLFPALYVVDSIVKFVGMPYIEYLEPHLPQMYKAIWEGVPQRRDKLDQTVGTWKGYFSDNALSNICKLVSPTNLIKPSDVNNSLSQLLNSTRSIAKEVTKVNNYQKTENITQYKEQQKVVVQEQQQKQEKEQQQQQQNQQQLDNGIQKCIGVDSLLNQELCVFSVPPTLPPNTLSVPPLVSGSVVPSILPLQNNGNIVIPNIHALPVQIPQNTHALPIQVQSVPLQPMQNTHALPVSMHTQPIQSVQDMHALPVQPVQSLPQNGPATMPIVCNNIMLDSLPVIIQQQIQQQRIQEPIPQQQFVVPQQFPQQDQFLPQQFPVQESVQQQQFFQPQFQSVPPPLPPFAANGNGVQQSENFNEQFWQMDKQIQQQIQQQQVFPIPEPVRAPGVIVIPSYNQMKNMQNNINKQWDYSSTEFDMKFLKEKHELPRELLQQNSLQTKRIFLDREFQRKHQKRLNPIQSTWWYASQDEWMKATSVGLGAKSATGNGTQENEVATADKNQAAQVYEVRVDDKQTKCGVSGDKLVAKWHKNQQDWFYENSVRLYGDLAVKYGVNNGTIVLVNCLDESDSVGREFVDNGPPIPPLSSSSVNDANFQVGVKRQLDKNNDRYRNVKVKQEVF